MTDVLPQALPQLQALLLRYIHLVTGLHIESLVPGIDMRQGPVDTPLTQSMRVALHTVAYFLFGDVLSPHTGIGDEEALFRRETVDRLERFGSRSVLESVEGYLQASVVGEVLTQCELTIGVKTGQHLDGIEEVTVELGTLLKAFGISSRPPVMQVAVGIVLTALVVEAVGHLVTNHHTDGTVVEGGVGLRIEERTLQDAGGKHISLVVGL